MDRQNQTGFCPAIGIIPRLYADVSFFLFISLDFTDWSRDCIVYESHFLQIDYRLQEKFAERQNHKGHKTNNKDIREHAFH